MKFWSGEFKDGNVNSKEIPIKETCFGNHLWYRGTSNEYEIKEIQYLIKLNYSEFLKSTRKRVASMGVNAWIEFGEMRLIDNPPFSGNPLQQLGSLAWVVEAKGRAFTIDRLKPLKVFKRYPDKRNVPKNKRGKRILVRSEK